MDGTQTVKKLAFYPQLSRVVVDSNKRDKKIVMGDLNAEVRTENEPMEHVKTWNK
jgi:exonuclease III